MCTAATYKTKDFYFGRTLDYEFSYGDEITITPRNYPFRFREGGMLTRHYAMIGMACVRENFPLYYEGVNEKGLGMAGLNFVGNAVYRESVPDKENVAQFDFIPWLLGQCASVAEAKVLLEKVNITNTSFEEGLPAAQLHWMIADREEAITVEAVEAGLRVYPNPVGILTNNPPFQEQMFQLNNYMNLSIRTPKNQFCDKLPLQTYSQGMGALGLPGDLSSQSRFVRAVFVKMNSASGDTESESVSQFFHILGAVAQPRGCCELDNGQFEVTLYTSCCNADRGVYYYTTYENHQITAVDMCRENLNGRCLIRYPAIRGEQIRRQN
ncbi:MAG: choloylglycine hydrolase family protein [Lachnospiraceae bacterium]|nr:choloylglycine hydrolase family protein [Lachnospiraceae bacterium]